MFAKIYRKILPLSFRQKIYDAFLGKILDFFRNIHTIITGKFFYFFGFLLPKTEKNLAYAFFGKHGLCSYPFESSLQYSEMEVLVEREGALLLPFVIHNGRKLFFPEHFSNEKVQREYIRLLIEQDKQSPHRYIPDYDELKGRTLLDVGAAEGILVLDTIELIKKAYLFEYEEFWQAPLMETFKPWKDKITIVRKFVSDQTEGLNVTIDDFLAERESEKLFIKMDIEGAERKALNGAVHTLQSARDAYLSVCAYHRKGDPEYISSFVEKYNFNYNFAPGYLFWNKRLSKAATLCYKSE